MDLNVRSANFPEKAPPLQSEYHTYDWKLSGRILGEVMFVLGAASTTLARSVEGGYRNLLRTLPFVICSMVKNNGMLFEISGPRSLYELYIGNVSKLEGMKRWQRAIALVAGSRDELLRTVTCGHVSSFLLAERIRGDQAIIVASPISD